MKWQIWLNLLNFLKETDRDTIRILELLADGARLGLLGVPGSRGPCLRCGQMTAVEIRAEPCLLTKRGLNSEMPGDHGRYLTGDIDI